MKRSTQVDPALVAEVREAYACATDGTSIHGLAAVRRRWPSNWAAILRACLSPNAPVAPDTTLGVYLRAGAGGLLVPRDSKDSNFKRRRAGARVLEHCFGKLRLAEITESLLERARPEYFEAYQDYSPEGLSREMTLLRKVVRRGQIACGLEPVAERWSSARSSCKRSGRGAPHPLRDISLLLEHLDREPDVRAIVAMVLGSRLWEAEVLGLELTDLDLGAREVTLRGRRTRGWPSGSADRKVPIAAWAVPLIRDWLQARGPRPSRLIFPNRNDPRRPRTSATRAVRGAARRASLDSAGKSRAPWTLSALRRDGQAVARAAGLPRCAVRGTVGPPGDLKAAAKTLRDAYTAARRLVDTWTRLVEPPVERAKLSRPVPRRAPKRTPANRPETGHRDPAAAGRSRKSWALPDSCRREQQRDAAEPIWFPEVSVDVPADRYPIPRAATAPPAAVPAIPDEAAEAVCRDMAVARGATNAALPEVPAAPESAPASVRVVRVPTLDRDAQEDAMAAGALSGGVVGFLIGLQRSKKDQGG